MLFFTYEQYEPRLSTDPIKAVSAHMRALSFRLEGDDSMVLLLLLLSFPHIFNLHDLVLQQSRLSLKVIAFTYTEAIFTAKTAI
ncbi:hypothetical protein GDO78_009554 [Eleutherodactylus coqui]|uniref:Uncharacterized protein n=1 Tax=Eleutherodactylus coqui TaxID=57060 RepID=A0A8J6FAE0_ELECQ|nr:hypothetical protein GDO78_009554 [Eleutherodactylus coqui]